MIEQKLVKQKLYEKYIEPTKNNQKKYIGIEIEMPLLNLKKEAVDFQMLHKLTKYFMDIFGFLPQNYDEEGNIYVAVHKETGDIFSYDCAYNNLEISLGKGTELNSLNERFLQYYSVIKEFLEKHNHTLTGMGVNPYRIYNSKDPIPNGRYRMLYHYIESYKNYDIPMYFHDYMDYASFTSASQVQLDVNYNQVVDVINIFSKLEPIKAVLFSNSVLLGDGKNLACSRDMLWGNSTHGVNPHNIGMYEEKLESIEDLIAYIESTSMFCAEKGEKYFSFPPINVLEYFGKDSIEGEYFDGKKFQKGSFTPSIEDLKYLRSYKFEDLTYRGTIEFRSACCQPISDAMCVAAFHIGLLKNIQELGKILDEDHVIYHHGYTASELRSIFNHIDWPEFVNLDQLYKLTKQIVDLAKKGLEDRGYGEEKYLKPLYERIEKRTNPAKKMLSELEAGKTIEDVIKEYGKVNYN